MTRRTLALAAPTVLLAVAVLSVVLVLGQIFKKLLDKLVEGTLPPEAMRQAFAYREQPNFPPRYNIAPTQPVPVVRLEQGTRQFILMRWGFIPGWVKDPKDYPLVINVRSESAREKPSFRAALARRRCLMPADGFYEWHRLGAAQRAGLYARCRHIVGAHRL